MAFRDLIPWSWGKKNVPVHHEEAHPVAVLQTEMNHLFDDFSRTLGFGGSSPWPFGHGARAFAPQIDVTETDDGIRILAELPGMEQKDLQVSLSDDILTLKGEKHMEKEDKGKDYYRMERSFGSFHRAVQIPCEVKADQVNASFKNGVLTVTLPKTDGAKQAKRTIEVKTN